jgi:hypothetical protein
MPSWGMALFWMLSKCNHSFLGHEDQMSESESTSRVISGVEGRRTVKKAYQKPEVRHERVFETMALACGKVQTTQGQCAHNRKNS